jgi:hypothetical protein
MGKKRNRKQSPLFYINQPSINLPQPDMQKNYSLKNSAEISESKKSHEHDAATTEGSELQYNAEIIESTKFHDVNTKNTDSKEVTGEKANSEAELLDVRKKKNFNEYSLEEKIKHLKLVPASVAKVKYEFITIAQSFKGYFLEIKGEVLFIHSISPRKKTATIRKEDLIDIKRVGL